MNPGQRATSRVLLGLLGALALVFVVGLAWEVWTFANAQEHDSISEVVRLAWEAQPGAVLLGVALVVGFVAYLGGHFFWGAKAPKP